jgi:excisionase family DNA binding protein
MTQDDQRLLTVAQAAQRYAVSEQTIRRWVAREVLPSVSMGRVVRIPIRAADQRMGVDP